MRFIAEMHEQQMRFRVLRYLPNSKQPQMHGGFGMLHVGQSVRRRAEMHEQQVREPVLHVLPDGKQPPVRNECLSRWVERAGNIGIVFKRTNQENGFLRLLEMRRGSLPRRLYARFSGMFDIAKNRHDRNKSQWSVLQKMRRQRLFGLRIQIPNGFVPQR